MTVTSLCAGEQGLHESLQCVQCLITFSDARSKERHVRNSHRDEYKRYLQQVGDWNNNDNNNNNGSYNYVLTVRAFFLIKYHFLGFQIPVSYYHP